LVRLEIGKLKIDFPEKWEELTPEDFSRVGHILLNEWNPALQYMIIRMLTPSVHPSVWVNLTDDELLALLPLTNFMKEPVKLKSMRLFRIGFRSYYLPDRSNILLADWAFSEQLVKAFVTTGNELFLNQLVATICRPKKWWIQLIPIWKKFNLKWNGDIREKFHSAIAEDRTPKIARVRWEVQRTNQILFSGSGKGGGGDWVEAAMEISERGLFGNFEQTMQTPFSMVVKYLNLQNNKAKQYE
jgi:hypothetical protein